MLIVNPYPAISFLTGFSLVKRVRAGTFAGTFSYLSGESDAKFLSLLCKLARVGFLELGKILQFPFYGR